MAARLQRSIGRLRVGIVRSRACPAVLTGHTKFTGEREGGRDGGREREREKEKERQRAGASILSISPP